MRGRIEIMCQILEVCKLPRSKTSVTRKANLNNAQLNVYLTFLISRELLERDSGKYVTTQKGCSLIEAMTELNSTLENYKRSISKELAREHITTSSGSYI